MTPWHSDEPDESLDDSCVAYLDGHWYNDPCSEEKPFFCVDGDYNGEGFLSFFYLLAFRIQKILSTNLFAHSDPGL